MVYFDPKFSTSYSSLILQIVIDTISICVAISESYHLCMFERRRQKMRWL
ncbi:hypothetical protein COCCADRAFT_112738 [Bipolaris zeicola 26-R-13]|uniref:Uncharacterized protein n=1 Tax=Cochliobolus carbonum (strain 26-R-13) TaxID=930089 RepID=W6XNE5_COCC2|nr:uncharacterized protein COCCADRAFT_112738 [Bipolaris zeicola 26-R-13]EUC27033.1 hypothetical protein COCCADRAFT_112738 [Bipolaris zeicola 26-R-13]